MSRPPRHPWRRALVVLLFALMGASAFLRSQVAWDGACTLGRRYLPVLLGLDVGLGRCELDPLRATVRVYGLSAFMPGTHEPLFAADLAEVSLGAFQPFLGRLELEAIRVKHPRLYLTLPSAERPPPPPQASSCALNDLARVVVRRLEVTDAEVSLALEDGRRVDLRGLDVGWKVRRGVAEFQVEAGRGSVWLGEDNAFALTKLYLEGGLDVGEQRLELSRGELGLEDVSLSVGGKVEQLCDPVLALDAQLFAPLRTLARAGRLEPEVGGHLWARVSTSGKPRDGSLSALLRGSALTIGRYSPGDFSAQLALSGNELVVRELLLPAGAGAVRASGTLKLAPGLPIRGRFETESAQFGELLRKSGFRGSWVDFLATGRGHASGTLLPAPNLAGEADLRLSRFQVASRAYDAPLNLGTDILEFSSARVQTGVRVLADRVELHGAKVELPGSGVSRSALTGDTTLYYDPNRGLEIHANAHAVDLGDLGHISGIPWAGRGSVEAHIAGPYGDVTIQGTASLRDAEFWKFSLGVVQLQLELKGKDLLFPSVTGQKGSTQYFGSGRLRFGKELLTEGTVQLARGGRTEDLIDLLAPMHSSLELFQGTLAGVASGKVRIFGPAKRFGGTVELDFADTTYYGRRLGDGRAVLRFDEGARMVLEPVALHGPLGVTELEGTWTFTGPLSYTFRGTNYSLAELVGGMERAKALGMGGELSVAGTVSGDTDTPVVKASLISPRVTFADRPLGRMQLEAELVGKDLQLSGPLFQDAQLFSQLKLKEPFPYEANVTLSLPEIRPLLPAGAISQGVSGSLSGTVNAQGVLKDLQRVSATAHIQKLAVSRGEFTATSEAPFTLSYQHGRFGLEGLRIRGPNTELSAAGWAGPSQVDVTMHGSFDMRLLETFLPSLERSAGRVELRASASGTMEDPKLVGSAELKDARLSLRDQAVSVRSLGGRVEFSDSRVILSGVEGILNDGRMALRGDVRLSRFKVQHVEVGLQLDEVSLRMLQTLPLTATGELLLYGKPEALVLTGDLDLVKLRYEQPLELETLLLEARKSRYVGGGERPREWLTFDVTVHAAGDVRIDNNLAKAKVEGALKLTGTNLRPGLLGTINAAEGSQAYFRGNQFQVTQGLVEFKERRSIEAVFDMHAQTQVREYLVRLHAFGRVTDPKVLLSSEPELSEGDILSLLALGVTSRDRTNTTETGAGLAAEALLKVSGLDRQVQRFLPKNTLLRDMSFHISSTYNNASGYAEPTARFEAKLLSEKLKLSIDYPIRTGRGARGGLEYQFNNRVAGQLQWENENSDTSTPDFGADLKFRWEVE